MAICEALLEGRQTTKSFEEALMKVLVEKP